MKRILIICLSLLCLLVCSCEKMVTKTLLEGTWKVSVTAYYKMTFLGTETEKTEDRGVWIFTFEDDGYGTIETDSKFYEFTYKYRERKKVIEYEMDGKDGVWYVDKLTGSSLVFHSKEDSSLGELVSGYVEMTYKGKRK